MRTLADINECKFKCRGSDMKCEDTEGSFKCDCANGKYDAELDTCIGQHMALHCSPTSVFFVVMKSMAPQGFCILSTKNIQASVVVFILLLSYFFCLGWS